MTIFLTTLPAQNQRLRYTDVYSSESDCEQLEVSQPKAYEFKIINVGDFVIIKLASKKSYRHYVGKVVDKYDDGDFSVSFLRKSAGGKFVFPNVIEENSITREEVVKVLEPPVISRDRFSFTADFDLYPNLC